MPLTVISIYMVHLEATMISSVHTLFHKMVPNKEQTIPEGKMPLPFSIMLLLDIYRSANHKQYRHMRNVNMPVSKTLPLLNAMCIPTYIYTIQLMGKFLFHYIASLPMPTHFSAARSLSLPLVTTPMLQSTQRARPSRSKSSAMFATCRGGK